MGPSVNTLGRPYDEKRNYIRMRVNTEATLKRDDGQVFTGHCHNLSGGGALLELEKPETVDSALEITINSPHGHSPMFSALGKVVRSIKDSSGERFLVAVTY